MENWFSELKVVDLSTVLAGPSVATFFAEMGAQVVKVENPITHGDVTRQWKLKSESQDSPVSAYFASVNYGKHYVSANLLTPEGNKMVIDLLKDCDIVITNFKKGDATKYGVDYTSISVMNPGIIYGEIKGFENGDERLAYDVVLQAETGFMSMNGTPESGPVKMPVALVDVLAAHQLKEGILAALWRRQITSRGYHVSCSLEAAAISSLVNQASNYLMSGVVAGRVGSLHPNIAPYGETLHTADGQFIVLAIGNNDQFNKFCELTELHHLTEDPDFSDNQLRVLHRKSLFSKIKDALQNRSAEEWMTLFRTNKIPAGTIRNIAQVLDSEDAKPLILEELIDGINTRRIKTAIFKISET